ARPLLCVRREETGAYCERRGLAFSDDESNEDERLLRNRVRRQLLPAFERGWPTAREALVATSVRARAAVRVLDHFATAAIVDQSDDRVVLSRCLLRELVPSVSAHAFRVALARLVGDAREFERQH